MIVVTGGAGFIGSILVKELNRRGRRDIIIVERPGEDDRWKNLYGLAYYDLVEADQFLALLASNQLPQIELIFHLGAESSTTVRDFKYLLANNVAYAQTLFRYAAEAKIDFIYASSAATYGDGAQGYREDQWPLYPLNGYGMSKYIFDQWAVQQTVTPPVWAGLRFFNVYGPHEFHKGPMSSVVLQGFKQAQEKKVIRLFKSHHPDYQDGEQSRDFIYVKDVVRGMLDLHAALDEEHNGIYNLGTGKARSFKDLALAVFAALGLPPDIEYIPTPEHIRDQYQYFTQADMQKFKSILPHFTFTSLEEGVQDYVQNYLLAKNPYAPQA